MLPKTHAVSAIKNWTVMLAATFLSIEAFADFDSSVLAASDSAKIAWHQVAAPSGNVLLMRNDEGTCAIRFTSFQATGGSTPPTTFSSGDKTYTADYEWSFAVKQSSTGVQYGSGRATKGALWGIGRSAFGGGDPYIRCGPMKALWLPRASISFSDKVTCKAAVYQLAPTRWKSLSQVRLDDLEMKWFECDENRKLFYIPERDL
ncbi:hypothetical protein GNX71_11750 [Variovorax sp. RKNM96]|uniref:hypothetical protein n=1 Tax=Variovorax sp. RKNM96 TaxID=2681552 RepID=UPI00197E4EF9|nr:hypothetical protein [Variovorax sp. RKNM96]QSI30221.1 hypothetical protein GNX71_11750 [Variovorax sp. RKNM96]